MVKSRLSSHCNDTIITGNNRAAVKKKNFGFLYPKSQTQLFHLLLNKVVVLKKVKNGEENY